MRVTREEIHQTMLEQLGGEPRPTRTRRETCRVHLDHRPDASPLGDLLRRTPPIALGMSQHRNEAAHSYPEELCSCLLWHLHAGKFHEHGCRFSETEAAVTQVDARHVEHDLPTEAQLWNRRRCRAELFEDRHVLLVRRHERARRVEM